MGGTVTSSRDYTDSALLWDAPAGDWESSGDRVTRAWRRYEQGRSYNNRLTPNQYNLVNTNIEFFSGNQWLHLTQTPAMQRLPKPVFNIIKRVTNLFVASLTSSAASITFDELSYYSANKVNFGGAEREDGLSHKVSGEVAEEAGTALSAVGGQPGGPGMLGATGGVNREFHSEEENAAAVATAEVQNLLEKFKMDYRIREALFDGAQTGDYCAHFWWDPEAIPYGGAFGEVRGEIRMELVDGINVMFGNPNTPDVERQPYILILGRDTVENLRQELKLHRKKREKTGPPAEPSAAGPLGRRRSDGVSEACRLREDEGYEDWIDADAEYTDQAGIGGRTELEADDRDGKALYVYMYEKKDGTVHVTKATKSAVIYEDIDTGLSRYPIAWGNWEKQKNQYHGRALVTGIVPNQIFINTTFAMMMRHLQLMGFPKTVYNADLIGQWNSEVGQAIGVRGLQPGQSVSQVAYHLQPADMSAQIMQVIDKAVSYTKDCLGATDAQLGNVKPDNTSALMVLQSSAEVPLENTRAGLYEWLEDVGAILLDMMGTYYGERPVVRSRSFQEPVTGPGGAPELDPVTGMMRMVAVERRVAESFDFDQFKNLWFNVRVNAGATTYYSEIAMVQTLDNLRRDGVLEVVDYLERIPDKLIPRKAELVQELKKKASEASRAGPMDWSAGAKPAPKSGAFQPQAGGKRAVGSRRGVSASGAASPLIGGPVSEEAAVSALPVNMQTRYANMPGSAQSALRQLGAMSVGR